MKKLISIFSFLLPLILAAQSFTTTAIPLGTDFIRPDAGGHLWNNRDAPFGTIDIPINDAPQESKDYYFRGSMTHFFNGTGLDSTIVFGFFDARMNEAIDHRQGVRWRTMGLCNNCGNPPQDNFNNQQNYAGGWQVVPQFLHNLQQAEPNPQNRDFFSTRGDSHAWVMNLNSPQVQRWIRKLSLALRNHIDATSHNGVAYRDAFKIYDIGFYGCYSEQHSNCLCDNVSELPAGFMPTAASLIEVVDAQLDAMGGNPNWKYVIPFNSLDAIWLPHTYNPVAYGQYLVDHPDSISWINDHIGSDEGYDHSYWENNNRLGSRGGISRQVILNNRWRYSPTGGEPVGWGSPADRSAIPAYVSAYHMSFFGNGNLDQIAANGQDDNGWPTEANNIRLAARQAGYRLRIPGGNVNVGASLVINTNWLNEGVAPVYYNWRVEYLIKNGSGTTVSTLTSSFRPRYFQPTTAAIQKTDVYAIPAIPAGSYGLYIKVSDTTGYRSPMPLAITPQLGDGSYFLVNITIPTGTTNQLPTVNAGVNQSINTSSTNVTATANDPDGTISAYLWTQVTGPNTATITAPTTASTSLTGLISGIYNFNIKVTDNNSAVANDQIQITVNTNSPPVANAGANQVITLPTSNVSVSGAGSTDDNGIIAYQWNKVAGPNTFVITSPTSSSTTITGMTTAGIYTYRLTVTDGSDAISSDDMNVTVNAGNTPPISNAGANQTITLPTSTVSLSGSLSSDNVGITSYSWAKVGGPASFTITTPSSVNTTVTGLTTGIYIFRLTVSDVAELTSSDDVQVTVNAIPNTAPVANAGANQNITLPVNSVNVSGSASTDNIGITSYSWARLSGPLIYTITTPSSVNTSITGLIQGVYQFRLTVTDGGGLTNTDDVDITVQAAPNTAPVANAGANQSITLPTSSVTVSGASSTDDIGITGYLWTKISGTGGTIVSSTSSSTLITGLIADNYVYRLRVQDASGLFNTDDVIIQVNPAANNAPVAAAGNNQTITLPTSAVTLSASGSSDDAGIVGYNWSKISGTGGIIVSSNSSSTLVTGLTQGTYTYRLTVTDGFGLTNTDDVLITVNNQPTSDNNGHSKWWQFWHWIFKSR